MQYISDKFDELYAILEDRKRKLIETVGHEQDQKLGHVRSLIRCHGDHLEMSVKLVETAIQSMEEPQMAVFLQVTSAPPWHWCHDARSSYYTLKNKRFQKVFLQRCHRTFFEMPFSEKV